MNVCGQPICILQMGHMLLKWVVNNIWHTWLWGFNSQVRVNVLSYNLICLSFSIFGSYINFIHWFLYGLVSELGCDWCISLYIRKSLSVISFGFSSTWREREHWHLSSSYTISHVFCFQVKDMRHVRLISIKIVYKTIMH